MLTLEVQDTAAAAAQEGTREGTREGIREGTKEGTREGTREGTHQAYPLHKLRGRVGRPQHSSHEADQQPEGQGPR